ncbi:hypothetical protein GCM10010387_45050 [Streptomyces inusitatus]|uniref:Uncharacterized protein n=1 Tax=Streptomyces inusitatus TaxID=68221 RepID=A0A918UZK0_9ACTN|nr:hypothetical protein GCM10010387_45050 [Streptomyces inusitatus]
MTGSGNPPSSESENRVHQREPVPDRPEVGSVMRDAASRRVGRVMGLVGGRVQLRPLNGGCEWDAVPGDLSPAIQSDAMSAAVAEANAYAVSRWGR